MKENNALIYGYNEYGLEIAKNIVSKYKNIVILTLNDDINMDSSDFKVEKFDLSDKWEELNLKYDIENSKVFCTLMDVAQNIFLTISLKSAYKDISIVALANSSEDVNKLYMAGASKVIPIVETTARIITDMLKKPILTNVLHSILYEDGELKVMQLKVTNDEYFKDKYTAEIDWSVFGSVLVLSIVHEDMSKEFVYSSKSKHNYIKRGDILISVGYEADLDKFRNMIGEYV